MKKIHKLFASFLVLTSAFLTGCFSPVFYEIRKDVKPEDTTVKSPINSVTHVTIGNDEFLVIASDSGLRYKRADSNKHDEWKVYNTLPFKMHYYNFDTSSHDGEQLIGVYSTSDYLYILSSSFTVNEDMGTTYPSNIKLSCAPTSSISSDGTTWSDTATWETVISDSENKYFPIYIYSSSYHSGFGLIHTNSIQKANRKLYIRKGDPDCFYDNIKPVSYFEVNGTSVTEIKPEVITSEKSKKYANSAVVFKGKPLFFAGYAATTDETLEKSAEHYYYSLEGDLYYGNGTDTIKAISLGKTISALATCQDAILIGCANYTATTNSSSNGGIYKTTLAEGIPGSALTEFTTNAKFQITDSYYVTALLNATPEKTETESYLYCGIQVFGTDSANLSGSFDNVGLWSYYPERGNWNRE